MCLHMWHVHSPIMSRVTRAGSGEREGEREGGRHGCDLFVYFYVVLEFAAQGGPFQVHLITALLHIKPKRIKEHANYGDTIFT